MHEGWYTDERGLPAFRQAIIQELLFSANPIYLRTFHLYHYLAYFCIKMEISFGQHIEGTPYKVLDERVMRASAGIMLLLGLIAFVNGFVLDKYEIIPYISGFLALNFLIGIFLNPKYAPTYFVASRIVKGQSPLFIGAIQKKFAWSLGLLMSGVIFILSLFLLKDPSYFKPVCFICLWCLAFLYFESAFGICVGCIIYHFFIRVKILKQPEIKPNCMGDSCDI